MNVKRFMLLCFSLILCTVVSAQTYSVRVTHNTNLRASFSLDARIVDTALAGATLSVTGSQEQWLTIDRNGREVWMADWVPMTRVEAGPVSADINNCCFVDRQCNSDQEWTAGYWAFQNNQCGAPIAPVSSVAAPISTIDAAEENNCCFIGWLCNSDYEWQQGFWSYQAGQCEHQGVTIEGSEAFTSIIDAALKLLLDRAPNWYTYTLDGLNKIREVPGSRFRVSSRTGEARMGSQNGNLVYRNTFSLAATLTHEACHVHRRLTGQYPTGKLPGETACTQIEIYSMEAIGADQSTIQREKNLLANIHKPECQWWNNPEHSRVAAHCYDQP